jgi:hypothetical protein
MLTNIGDGIWIATGPVSFLGLQLTANMSVLRLHDGTLLVHSPLPLCDALRAEVSALGRVTQLYAPNTFHHQWLTEWIAAFPDARVHAPEELAAKRPDLRIDRFHDAAVSGACMLPGVAEIPIRGFRLRETALIHHASGTAIVTDLVHNIGRPEHTWTKAYTKLVGFYDRVALSRMLRWTGFDDRSAARSSIDAVLGHSFAHLIMGHGAPIAHNGREALALATAWLPAAQRSRSVFGSKRFAFKPCG